VLSPLEKATVDVKDNSGHTPLRLAVANGHLELVQRLFNERVTRFASDVEMKEATVSAAI